MTRGRFGGTRGWLSARSRRFSVEGVIVAVKTVAMVVLNKDTLHLADPLRNGQGRFDVERLAELSHASDNSRLISHKKARAIGARSGHDDDAPLTTIPEFPRRVWRRPPYIDLDCGQCLDAFQDDDHEHDGERLLVSSSALCFMAS